ncbi:MULTISPECIES: acyl carrier protein [unclassified Rhodanobacter]|uniref:acyl carrier protein n=1 Tax=unclassified Rhodanobacter TaxID=2621553 RepID=UPI0009ED1384|nr:MULTISPECIES: acyl carrier protein [unclassified Rhodanobacter]
MINKLSTVIAEILEVPSAAITVQTSAATEEHWDSLRHMQIIFAIEDAFGVHFRDEEIPLLTSVQAISDALVSYGADPV